MKRSATPRATPDGFEPGAVVSRRVGDDIIARLAPASYDTAARTVEAVFSTGARVRRWGVFEELAITPEAIDLGRVSLGQVRLLDTHNSGSIDAVLGVVTQATIRDGQLVGLIRFADTPAGRAAESMVATGDLTGISVGYRVTSWSLTGIENDVEIWRAERWELLEVSLVAVPADPTAMVRSGSANSTTPGARAPSEEDADMRRNVTQASGAAPAEPIPPVVATPAVVETRAAAPVQSGDTAAMLRAERARTSEILEIGRGHAIDQTAVDEALSRGTSVDDFRRIALDAIASRSERHAIVGASVGASADDPAIMRGVMSEALTSRLQAATGARVEPSERARQYMGHSIAEMAAVVLGERAMPRTSRERVEVLERAFHTTSDFPIIFSTALNTRLESAYAAAAPTYRRISQRSDFVDFRPHDIIRAGDFPMLQPVTQAGEIKFGTFGEKKETIAVAPYGIQIAVTRQMLVNDTLGAIDQMLANQGTTVALFEEVTFFAMKGTVGPTLKEDNKSVYHADHGNLGTAAAITVDSLSLARAAVRKMKRLDGNLMNLTPRILLVGPDKETEAEKITATVQPQQASNVNPFSGRLETVVSGQMAGNAWELYTDLTFGANWQWGLLDGFTAPRMRVDTPFGQQGVGVSLEHDFGCGPADFRFGYRNPGA